MTTNMQGNHEGSDSETIGNTKKIVGKGRLFSWREEERNEKKDIWQTICQDGAEFAESCAQTQGVGAESMLHHK